MALCAISATGSAITVGGGFIIAAASKSSMPTTETASGTFCPSSPSACSTPSFIMLERAKTAVGGRGRRMTSSVER